MSEFEHEDHRGSIRTTALYVVATPLGNLGDITRRAVDVLRAADLIAAEDTRHSRRLLDHYGISTDTLALHEHNEASAAARVVGLLREGKAVALITDAGTPAVSDPGARTVAAVREAGFRVVPVPGPNAAVAALSASGLNDPHFYFYGFLPPKQAARRKAIEDLRTLPAALVFYEAPHRIEEMVEDLEAVLEPEREIVLARELTKLYESIERMPLAAARGWLAAEPDQRRGEFVVIVSGAPPRAGLDAEAERILGLLLAELPLKQAVKLASEISGCARNDLYRRALELAKGR